MTEQQPTYYPPVAPPQPRNGLGTAALVLGIVGAALAWIPIIGFMGFVCGILGVVFGAIGWNRARKGAATNKGASIAGLVLSIVAIVVSSTVWVGTLNAVDDSLDDLDRDLQEISDDLDRDVDELEQEMEADEEAFNEWADCVDAIAIDADDYDTQLAACDKILD